MPINMEGFDAMVDEVLVERVVKTEGAADFMIKICLVKAHLGRKKFSVEVGGAKKVVMGE
ncbi:MAG: hypothetical protein IH614_17135 [Desulfuromonadales bacterium]|nr:hypothetical protein [Desulfuromonadales bacterium]